MTADSKAHHEIGLTSAGGMRGCRRYTVVGEYITEKRHYYYGEFLYRYWYPCPPTTAKESRRHGKAADSAETVAERKRLSKENGVTGETILYRLYDLCGFDPVKDLVIDAMHAIVLNLIRTELESHIMADLASNASLPPLERVSMNGGLLCRKDLVKALGKVPWTSELKNGRIPSIPKDGHKLSFWKAEEFSKFIQVAPIVLRGLIPHKAYKCFCLLKEIHDLVFSRRLRIQGWTTEHITYFKHLLWSHAILFEELYGVSACTENLEYSLHMPEDIERHSTMDNYWCYLYERQVKYYKQQTSNMKGLCKTFTDRAGQLRFVNTWISTNFPAGTCSPSLKETYTSPILLCAPSVDAAISMKESISSDFEEIKRCLASGIVLGKLSYRFLEERQVADIQYWLGLEDELPNACQSCSRVLHTNDYDVSIVYRTGEHVIVNDAECEDKEWLVHLTDIIVYGPINNQFHLFLNGTFYSAKTAHGEIETDSWTGNPKMVKRDYRRLCVYPLHLINRKVMVYPESESYSSWLIIDTDCPIVCREVKISYCPKPGDVLKVKSGRTTAYCNVNSVDLASKTMKAYYLRLMRGEPRRWTLSKDIKTVQLSQIVCHMSHRMTAGCVYILN